MSNFIKLSKWNSDLEGWEFFYINSSQISTINPVHDDVELGCCIYLINSYSYCVREDPSVVLYKIKSGVSE